VGGPLRPCRSPASHRRRKGTSASRSIPPRPTAWILSAFAVKANPVPPQNCVFVREGPARSDRRWLEDSAPLPQGCHLPWPVPAIGSICVGLPAGRERASSDIDKPKFFTARGLAVGRPAEYPMRRHRGGIV